MENYLDIDLNEIASKHIAQKIEDLETQVKTLQEEKSKLYNENKQKDIEIDKSKLPISILNSLRDTFSNITTTYPDGDKSYSYSTQRNQYTFIENILSTLFGVEKEMNGWYCHRGDGNLKTHLAINFYKNKDLVINLLSILKEKSQEDISFIRSYKLPYDYPKEDVISFLESPQYNTNGAIFEVSSYWVEYGAGKSNMPHGLIHKSPFILEDDVFDILVDSIEKRVSNYYYLYAVTKYADLPKEKIARLGETIISLKNEHRNYDYVKDFISGNISNFNKKTLDFLFTLASDDNQFKTLNWQRFPYNYQVKYLKEKNFEQVMKILNGYDCRWTLEEKQKFFKQYAKHL